MSEGFKLSFCLSKMFSCLDQVLCILFVRGFYGLCVGGFLYVLSIFFFFFFFLKVLVGEFLHVQSVCQRF